MSLETQYRALYAMIYKRAQPAPELGNVDHARVEAVIGLHANDIGNNWYSPRFPATWLALQVALDGSQAEVTRRLAASDAFELRVNDDFDGRALAAFVAEAAPKNAPWLSELLRYERMIAGHWPDAASPRVETFAWDVAGVREALLEKELFPVDEQAEPLQLLLHKDDAGVNELVLSPDQARVLKRLLAREKIHDEEPMLVAKCRRVLNQLKG